MIQEFHEVSVDITFLRHNQFSVPLESTSVSVGPKDNLYFRYNGNVYKFSRTGVRLKRPNYLVFYFHTSDSIRFESENPGMLGSKIKIEIFNT
jgi:hypothetical protein